MKSNWRCPTEDRKIQAVQSINKMGNPNHLKISQVMLIKDTNLGVPPHHLPCIAQFLSLWESLRLPKRDLNPRGATPVPDQSNIRVAKIEPPLEIRENTGCLLGFPSSLSPEAPQRECFSSHKSIALLPMAPLARWAFAQKTPLRAWELSRHFSITFSWQGTSLLCFQGTITQVGIETNVAILETSTYQRVGGYPTDG